jgi:uncharacterized membrane protein
MYFKGVAWVIQKVRERPLLFFAFIHTILFLAYFAILDQSVGNAGVPRQFAVKILDGQLPYSDFFSEYPPLALLSFLLPALFSTTQPAYGFLFAVEMLLLDLVVLFILAKFAARFKIRVWRVLSIYTLCLLAIGPIVTGRYDLLPATLVLVALYAFVSGRHKTAWAVLALGATAKIYPVIIAPLFALYLLYHRQYRQLTQGIAIFGAVLLAINLPWIIINADGFWQFISYHLERGLHSESSYGSVLLIGQIMGLTQVEGAMTYGSWNLSSPMADTLSQVSSYITASLLMFLYALYAHQLLRKSDSVAKAAMLNTGTVELILRYSLLAVFIMLLTSKLFSPQFLIWLVPLIPLVRARWRYAPWVLFLIIGGLTQYIYPHYYLDFEAFVPYLVIMLAIRNFLLVVMAILYLLPTRSLSANGEG